MGSKINIHDKMREELAKYGAHVDAIYCCPHHPDDNCDCRKPKPTLVFRAARELNLDVKQSYVIGDSEIDIGMGKRAGCKACVIVGSDNRGNQTANTFQNFQAAVRWMIEQEKLTVL